MLTVRVQNPVFWSIAVYYLHDMKVPPSPSTFSFCYFVPLNISVPSFHFHVGFAIILLSHCSYKSYSFVTITAVSLSIQLLCFVLLLLQYHFFFLPFFPLSFPLIVLIHKTLNSSQRWKLGKREMKQRHSSVGELEVHSKLIGFLVGL
jgi:hypothetical protein